MKKSALLLTPLAILAGQISNLNPAFAKIVDADGGVYQYVPDAITQGTIIENEISEYCNTQTTYAYSTCFALEKSKRIQEDDDYIYRAYLGVKSGTLKITAVNPAKDTIRVYYNGYNTVDSKASAQATELYIYWVENGYTTPNQDTFLYEENVETFRGDEVPEGVHLVLAKNEPQIAGQEWLKVYEDTRFMLPSGSLYYNDNRQLFFTLFNDVGDMMTGYFDYGGYCMSQNAFGEGMECTGSFYIINDGRTYRLIPGPEAEADVDLPIWLPEPEPVEPEPEPIEPDGPNEPEPTEPAEPSAELATEPDEPAAPIEPNNELELGPDEPNDEPIPEPDAPDMGLDEPEPELVEPDMPSEPTDPDPLTSEPSEPDEPTEFNESIGPDSLASEPSESDEPMEFDGLSELDNSATDPKAAPTIPTGPEKSASYAEIDSLETVPDASIKSELSEELTGGPIIKGTIEFGKTEKLESPEDQGNKSEVSKGPNLEPLLTDRGGTTDIPIPVIAAAPIPGTSNPLLGTPETPFISVSVLSNNEVTPSTTISTRSSVVSTPLTGANSDPDTTEYAESESNIWRFFLTAFSLALIVWWIFPTKKKSRPSKRSKTF